MKTSLRPTTWENYQTQVEKHLKPCLGKHALGKLKTSHIQQFYNAKMMGKRANKKEGGLSAKSIRNIHNVLHSALEQAFKEGLIRINPAKAVRLPRGGAQRNANADPGRHQEVYGGSQANTLLYRLLFGAIYRAPTGRVAGSAVAGYLF